MGFFSHFFTHKCFIAERSIINVELEPGTYCCGDGGRQWWKGSKKGGWEQKRGWVAIFGGEGGWMAKTFSGRVVKVMWRGGMVKFAKKIGVGITANGAECRVSGGK